MHIHLCCNDIHHCIAYQGGYQKAKRNFRGAAGMCASNWPLWSITTISRVLHKSELWDRVAKHGSSFSPKKNHQACIFFTHSNIQCGCRKMFFSLMRPRKNILASIPEGMSGTKPVPLFSQRTQRLLSSMVVAAAC